MELGEPERGKNDKKVKLKGGLGWIKRRARTRHELARLVMGTIFLVISYVSAE